MDEDWDDEQLAALDAAEAGCLYGSPQPRSTPLMSLPYRRCQISSPNKKVGAKEPFQTTVKTPIASVKTMEWVA